MTIPTGNEPQLSKPTDNSPELSGQRKACPSCGKPMQRTDPFVLHKGSERVELAAWNCSCNPKQAYLDEPLPEGRYVLQQSIKP